MTSALLGPQRNNLPALVEQVGQLVGLPEGFEEGRGRQNNLEPRRFPDVVADMEHAIDQLKNWRVLDEKHGIKVTNGHLAAPPHTTPEQFDFLLSKVNNTCLAVAA